MSKTLSTTAAAVWASIARTLVPAIVGQLLGLVLTGVYYAGVRVLETYVASRFGWLLGLARTPNVCTAQSPAATPDPLASLSADLARGDEWA